jgi:ribosomal protein L11 methyltransferase
MDVQAAVDIDHVALHACRRNAELNDFSGNCQTFLAEPTAESSEPLAAAGHWKTSGYDVCFANILKPALLDLRERICGYVRPGGHLVLSGILPSQVRFVCLCTTLFTHYFHLLM